MNHSTGILYLIPCTLHDSNPNILLPDYILKLSTLRHFVVEDIRTTRRFLRTIIPDFDIDHSTFWEMDKHDPKQDFKEAIDALKARINIGLLSEAGCPGIADPGSVLVLTAHSENIQVIPWIGPSSITLSLMASGMNGQGFTFHGYLPAKKGSDLITKILQYEKESQRTGYSQLFIETPYRNQSLFEILCQYLKPTTLLCIAADITGTTEWIRTQSISTWRSEKIDLNKRPAIFIILAQ